MKPYLILLSAYPPDEIYLMKEIPYLQKNFEVLFFSRERTNYNNVTVENIEDLKAYIIPNPMSNLVLLMKSMLTALFKKEVWSELNHLRKDKKLTLSSVKEVLYFSAVSTSDARYVYKTLKNESIDSSARVIFYSYRLNSAALSLVKLMESFENGLCVGRGHGIDLYHYRNPNNILPFRSKIYQNFYKIFCISENGRQYLYEFGKNIPEISLSRLGTEDYGIQEQVEKSENDRFFIVSCSRISPEKRVENIVTSLTYIENIKIHWVHIGEGRGYETLVKFANSKLMSKENITYEFTGNLNNESIIEFYSNHYIDLFINVSSYEGIPVSIMEACSFGIPIIATDVGGTKEIVFNQRNGLLIAEETSPKELAIHIEAILNNKEKSLKMREYSRHIWKEDYHSATNYSVFSNQLLSILDE